MNKHNTPFTLTINPLPKKKKKKTKCRDCRQEFWALLEGFGLSPSMLSTRDVTKRETLNTARCNKLIRSDGPGWAVADVKECGNDFRCERTCITSMSEQQFRSHQTLCFNAYIVTASLCLWAWSQKNAITACYCNNSKCWGGSRADIIIPLCVKVTTKEKIIVPDALFYSSK